jgi:hypothetical protein
MLRRAKLRGHRIVGLDEPDALQLGSPRRLCPAVDVRQEVRNAAVARATVVRVRSGFAGELPALDGREDLVDEEAVRLDG